MCLSGDRGLGTQPSKSVAPHQQERALPLSIEPKAESSVWAERRTALVVGTTSMRERPLKRGETRGGCAMVCLDGGGVQVSGEMRLLWCLGASRGGARDVERRGYGREEEHNPLIFVTPPENRERESAGMSISHPNT